MTLEFTPKNNPTLRDVYELQCMQHEIQNSHYMRFEKLVDRVDKNTTKIAHIEAGCNARHSTAWSTWGRAGAILLGVIAVAGLILGFLQLK